MRVGVLPGGLLLELGAPALNRCAGPIGSGADPRERTSSFHQQSVHCAMEPLGQAALGARRFRGAEGLEAGGDLLGEERVGG